ncbi:unnamed protein product [Parnassius apollo]|uniref:(apollo) hypothetical protein n=1 Tax=Parnassius apollo TaxID=110799 RepID=A0A8S3W7N1_PARAO|nr:unnamed protein product [Parnassius apollo]
MRPKNETDTKVQTGTFILSEKIDDTKAKKSEKELKKEMKRLEKEKQEREKKEKKAREKEKEREKQSKKGKVVCGACGGKCSGEVLRVTDKYFHTACFTCRTCSASLARGGFFCKDGHYYCPQDYQRAFGTRCAACNQYVEGEVVSALGNTYHQKCFTCARCKRAFPSGEKVTYTGSEVISSPSPASPASPASPDRDDVDRRQPDPNDCAGCGQELSEGQALVALDRQWHTWCFACGECGAVLRGEYMGRGGVPYCERDYQRLYGVRCAYCQRYISGKVLQVRAHRRQHTQSLTLSRAQVHWERRRAVLRARLPRLPVPVQCALRLLPALHLRQGVAGAYTPYTTYTTTYTSTCSSTLGAAACRTASATTATTSASTVCAAPTASATSPARCCRCVHTVHNIHNHLHFHMLKHTGRGGVPYCERDYRDYQCHHSVRCAYCQRYISGKVLQVRAHRTQHTQPLTLPHAQVHWARRRAVLRARLPRLPVPPQCALRLLPALHLRQGVAGACTPYTTYTTTYTSTCSSTLGAAACRTASATTATTSASTVCAAPTASATSPARCCRCVHTVHNIHNHLHFHMLKYTGRGGVPYCERDYRDYQCLHSVRCAYCQRYISGKVLQVRAHRTQHTQPLTLPHAQAHWARRRAVLRARLPRLPVPPQCALRLLPALHLRQGVAGACTPYTTYTTTYTSTCSSTLGAAACRTASATTATTSATTVCAAPTASATSPARCCRCVHTVHNIHNHLHFHMLKHTGRGGVPYCERDYRDYQCHHSVRCAYCQRYISGKVLQVRAHRTQHTQPLTLPRAQVHWARWRAVLRARLPRLPVPPQCALRLLPALHLRQGVAGACTPYTTYTTTYTSTCSSTLGAAACRTASATTATTSASTVCAAPTASATSPARCCRCVHTVHNIHNHLHFHMLKHTGRGGVPYCERDYRDYQCHHSVRCAYCQRYISGKVLQVRAHRTQHTQPLTLPHAQVHWARRRAVLRARLPRLPMPPQCALRLLPALHLRQGVAGACTPYTTYTTTYTSTCSSTLGAAACRTASATTATTSASTVCAAPTASATSPARCCRCVHTVHNIHNHLHFHMLKYTGRGGVPYCERDYRDYQCLHSVRCAYCQRYISGKVLQVRAHRTQHTQPLTLPHAQAHWARRRAVLRARLPRLPVPPQCALRLLPALHLRQGVAGACTPYTTYTTTYTSTCSSTLGAAACRTASATTATTSATTVCAAPTASATSPARCCRCVHTVHNIHNHLHFHVLKYTGRGGVPYCERDYRDYQCLHSVRCAYCQRYISGKVLQVRAHRTQHTQPLTLPHAQVHWARRRAVLRARLPRLPVPPRCALRLLPALHLRQGVAGACTPYTTYTTTYTSTCSSTLGRGGVPYCERDYRDYQCLYGVRCAYCQRYISGKVLQVRAHRTQHTQPLTLPRAQAHWARRRAVLRARLPRLPVPPQCELRLLPALHLRQGVAEMRGGSSVKGRGCVLQAGENHHFHPTCARCSKCGDPFGDGEEMFLQGAAIWHPRCGPAPGDPLALDRACSELQFSMRSRTPSVNGSYCSPYSSLTRKYGYRGTSPGPNGTGRWGGWSPARITTYSYLASEPATLRRCVQPYDRPPTSPHFHRPPSSASMRTSSRPGSKASSRPGMRVLVDSMRSETPRPKSPHMNNEEPIELSHYPSAYKPPPGTQPKIERDDFPAPPYPYTDPERRRRRSETFKGVTDSDEEDGKPNGEVNGVDNKLRREEHELAKIESGIAQVFLKEVKEREKLQQWKKQNLDPRNASRTPSAAREAAPRLRYSSPVGASPSRTLDRELHRPASAATALASHQHIPSYNARCSTLPGGARLAHGDFTFSGMGDKTHSTDFSSGKSDISAGSITDVDRSAVSTEGGVIVRGGSAAGGVVGGMGGAVSAAAGGVGGRVGGVGPRGGGVRRSLPNMATSHLLHEPAKLYPYHLLLITNYRLPPDVDRLNLERHLSDAEFEAILQVARSEFYRLPQWRRNELKRRARLF